MEYHPGQNGRLKRSCRKVGQAIGVSKDRAARALTQLECLGWLKVERLAKFGRRNAPAHYALTMFANDETGDPASFAFEHIDPDNPFLGSFRVAPQGHSGRISGTASSRQRDMNGHVAAFDQYPRGSNRRGFSTELKRKPPDARRLDRCVRRS
jgi:hypothetical protein